MELQHVNVKLLLSNPAEVDLEPLIPIFHSWIQDSIREELLLDVADYRHVDAGPGIILIGYEGNYSVDNADHRLGVRYNRKTEFAGTNQDRLQQAARAALSACQRLEADPRLEGKFRFNGQEIEIFVNDRLLAPNHPATREAIKDDLSPFLHKLLGSGDYSLSFDENPRNLFRVCVKASQNFTAESLSKNLASD
jgi:hypothetical protein